MPLTESEMLLESITTVSPKSKATMANWTRLKTLLEIVVLPAPPLESMAKVQVSLAKMKTPGTPVKKLPSISRLRPGPINRANTTGAPAVSNRINTQP